MTATPLQQLMSLSPLQEISSAVTQVHCSTAHALLDPLPGLGRVTVTPAPEPAPKILMWLPSPRLASGFLGTWGHSFHSPPPGSGSLPPQRHLQLEEPLSCLDNHRELSRLSQSQLPPTRGTLYNANRSRPSPAHALCYLVHLAQSYQALRGCSPTLPALALQFFPKQQEHSPGAWMAPVLTVSGPLQKRPHFPEAFQYSVQDLSPTLLTPL